MLSKTLVIISILISLTHCKTFNSSTLNTESDVKGDFSGFTMGVQDIKSDMYLKKLPEVEEASSTFPRAYLFLPMIKNLNFRGATIDAVLRTSNNHDKSNGAQVETEGQWSTYNAKDLSKLTFSLLGSEDPKLELTLSSGFGLKKDNDFKFLIKKRTFDFPNNAKIDPFKDLKLFKISLDGSAFSQGEEVPQLNYTLKTFLIRFDDDYSSLSQLNFTVRKADQKTFYLVGEANALKDATIKMTGIYRDAEDRSQRVKAEGLLESLVKSE